MNKFILLGNLCDNPVFTAGQEESKNRVKFRLAYNHSKDKATFFSCTAWGKSAELINRLVKGNRILVEGDIEENEWNNQQTGQQQRDKQINVRRFDYVDFPEKAAQNSVPPQYNNQPPQQGYGAPPQGYPPQQGYGAPPQQNGYNQPPQGYHQPPQQGYGNAPAPGGYQQPGPQYGGQAPQPPAPPQHSYNQPPQQGFPPQQPPQGQQQFRDWNPNEKPPF